MTLVLLLVYFNPFNVLALPFRKRLQSYNLPQFPPNLFTLFITKKSHNFTLHSQKQWFILMLYNIVLTYIYNTHSLKPPFSTKMATIDNQ